MTRLVRIGRSRRTVVGMLAAMAGQAAAACTLGSVPTGDGRGPNSLSAPSAAPPAVKFPATMTVITVSNLHSEPGFKAAAEEFGRRNSVQMELAPGSPQKVVQMMAAGTPPDVFRRNQGAFSQQLADGSIRALDPYIQQSKDFKLADYFPHLVRVHSLRGKQYAVPEDFQPASPLYYNRAIFERAGEPLPTPDMPWSRFLEVARRLTRNTPDGDQYGYYFMAPFWDQFVYNHGGQVVDQTNEPTKCLLDQPAAIEGLQFMVDLQHKWKVMPSPQVRQEAGLANEVKWFQQGRLATVNGGTWRTADWTQAGDNLHWGMTLAPKGQNGKWHYGTGGAGWAIPQDAPSPEASWAFAKWQFGPLGWNVWLDGRDPKTFSLPALRSLAVQEAKRLETYYPNASQVVASADHIYFRPQGVGWERALAEVWNAALDDLHQNKAAVRTIVTDAVARINPILAART